MEITATDVKKLREITGAGLMDCKKALKEAEGDFKKAERLLKEMGLAAAAKRSGRATEEGRVFSYVDSTKGAILEISCETDFVARNEEFVDFGNTLVKEIAITGAKEASEDMKSRVAGFISKVKENMAIRRFTAFSAKENELLIDYVHGEGRVGVVVKFEAEDPKVFDNEKVKAFVFDCALHAVAFTPLFLSSKQISEDYITEQKEIFTKQAENLGKPEKVLAGIVKGKLNKHMSEICFVDQKFVKDDKHSVSDMISNLSKEAGGKFSIVDYVCYNVGGEI